MVAVTYLLVDSADECQRPFDLICEVGFRQQQWSISLQKVAAWYEGIRRLVIPPDVNLRVMLRSKDRQNRDFFLGQMFMQCDKSVLLHTLGISVGESSFSTCSALPTPTASRFQLDESSPSISLAVRKEAEKIFKLSLKRNNITFKE
jgi:hypothetical protein